MRDFNHKRATTVELFAVQRFEQDAANTFEAEGNRKFIRRVFMKKAARNDGYSFDLADDEARMQLDRVAHGEIIRRCGHHRSMNSLELLRGSVSHDVNSVTKLIVARFHLWRDAEESAHVYVSLGLDTQFLQPDAFERADCDVGNNHAGVEGGKQIFLWTCELIRAAQLKRLVHPNSEILRHRLAASGVARHM